MCISVTDLHQEAQLLLDVFYLSFVHVWSTLLSSDRVIIVFICITLFIFVHLSKHEIQSNLCLTDTKGTEGKCPLSVFSKFL